MIPLLVQDECLYIGNNLIIVPHRYDTHINYTDANLFLMMFLKGNYYDGWRIPTIKEFNYLISITQYLPPAYRHRPGMYWASDSPIDNERPVINMGYLKNGRIGLCIYKEIDKRYDVKMIRNLK